MIITHEADNSTVRFSALVPGTTFCCTNGGAVYLKLQLVTNMYGNAKNSVLLDGSLTGELIYTEDSQRVIPVNLEAVAKVHK